MGAVTSMDFFKHVPLQPPDPIFGITNAHNADPNPNKVNLGVGAYRDDEGKPWVLPVVHLIEKRLVEEKIYNKEYLPITGLPEFVDSARKLLLGDSRSIAEGRVATVQTLSGTGSLALAFVFIKRFLNSPTIYLSNPTWANHMNLVEGAYLQWKYYRYYDESTRGLNLDGMLEDLSAAEPGSVVLLHACAHNPTGVDPTAEQWQQILELIRAKNLVAFFDSAYQGFASGDLQRDAAAIRMFDEAGLNLIISQSFAKNFGLYGERVGTLSIIGDSPQTTENVLSQLSNIVRQLYSNPPRHGAEIVAIALRNREYYDMWERDLKIMAHRIIRMREVLFEEITKLGVPGTWTHIINQIGMFTYLGITEAQVKILTEKHHVYLTKAGRISMAGLNEAKCKYLAAAIQDAVGSAPKL
eukprot:c5329_g1_i2.p1 GENE.c5329_g1_i2~~c5329_g1_i2.p1  ORF type:complete len:412 (+),score=99.62 c5329_g1_i2:1-1236(+)